MVNLSLQTDVFPMGWKQALVLPLLKNPSLECVLSSYQPISNLSFISKLVERAVVDQINEHMMSHCTQYISLLIESTIVLKQLYSRFIMIF